MTAVVPAPCYVFGIIPADRARADPPPWHDAERAAGIGRVRPVTAGPIAAVVGSPPTDRPLGRAADLRLHDRVLATLVSAGTPVLPFRFGAVLASEQAVVDDLLTPHRERLRKALDRVRGRVQYTVRVTYEQDAVLREVLAAHPEIAALRGDPARSDLGGQIRLGRLVVAALESHRSGDADTVMGALQRVAVQVRAHAPGPPDEVLHAAALVDVRHRQRFERTVEDVGRRSAGRLRLRLVGPLAPYDFAGEG